MLRLFVDDTRTFPSAGCQCCRDAQSAMMLLSVMKFESVSLDYSLGRGCDTGLDILVWMKENGISVPHINIHSNHVIGRDKMYEYARGNFPDSQITLNMLPK